MNAFYDDSDGKEANKLIQSHCSSFIFKFLPYIQIFVNINISFALFKKRLNFSERYGE